MKRRVEEADCNALAFHCLVKFFKVALLCRENFGKRRFSLFNGVRADHFSECSYSVTLKEHMLCTAKTYTFCAECKSALCIVRCVGVCSDSELSVLVSPCHDSAELAADRSVNGRNYTVVDSACRTVDGDIIALDVCFAGKNKLLVFLVHCDIRTAGYAAGTHAAGDNGSVGGHTAADGQYTL